MNCMSFLHYIWSGSKPKTKMRSCLRTTLMNFFDPLHMLNTAHDWLSFKSLSRINFSAIYTVIYLLQFLWSYYYVAILPLYKIEYIYFYSINNQLILSASDTVYLVSCITVASYFACFFSDTENYNTAGLLCRFILEWICTVNLLIKSFKWLSFTVTCFAPEWVRVFEWISVVNDSYDSLLKTVIDRHLLA